MSIAYDDNPHSQNAYASPATSWATPAADRRPGGFFWLLFSFEGRIPRRAYWLAFLINTFGYMFALFFLAHLMADLGPTTPLRFVPFLVFATYLWIDLAAKAKRWHDRDKSAFWLLIGFVPIIGALWQLVELGFLPGTPGANSYGEECNADVFA